MRDSKNYTNRRGVVDVNLDLQGQYESYTFYTRN